MWKAFIHSIWTSDEEIMDKIDFWQSKNLQKIKTYSISF